MGVQGLLNQSSVEKMQVISNFYEARLALTVAIEARH
jgi:hypothetical protein